MLLPGAEAVVKYFSGDTLWKCVRCHNKFEFPGLPKTCPKCGGDQFEVARESILIITDNPRISDILSAALYEIDKTADVFLLHRQFRPASLTPSLKAAILASDIIYLHSDNLEFVKREVSFRAAVYSLCEEQGLRKIFSMPGVTEEMFEEGGVLALSRDQFESLEKHTLRLAIALTLAKKATIQSELGTDITLDLVGFDRKGIASTGRVPRGAWGNLPSGEAFVLPYEHFGEGRLVVDQAIAFISPPDEPIVLDVSMGEVRLREPERPQSASIREFTKSLEEAERLARPEEKPNVKRICEFGIGTNPNADVRSLIEQEKKLGTIHIAIGSNKLFGGNISAPNHIDMVIGAPTLTLDDTKIMGKGQLIDSKVDQFLGTDYRAYGDNQLDELTNDKLVAKVAGPDEVCLENGAIIRRWRGPRRQEYQVQIGRQEIAGDIRWFWENLVQGMTRAWSMKDLMSKAGKLVADSSAGEVRKAKQLILLFERYGVLSILGD